MGCCFRIIFGFLSAYEISRARMQRIGRRGARELLALLRHARRPAGGLAPWAEMIDGSIILWLFTVRTRGVWQSLSMLTKYGRGGERGVFAHPSLAPRAWSERKQLFSEKRNRIHIHGEKARERVWRGEAHWRNRICAESELPPSHPAVPAPVDGSYSIVLPPAVARSVGERG